MNLVSEIDVMEAVVYKMIGLAQAGKGLLGWFFTQRRADRKDAQKSAVQ
jgi:hypothetical protein